MIYSDPTILKFKQNAHLEVTLGSQSSSSLTYQGVKLEPGPGLGIHS